MYFTINSFTASLLSCHDLFTDLINALNGATVFSKLDLNSAYHQLELDETSRSMTTFSTHIGLRRYKRLIFGANCSAEIFQDALATALGGLRGVMNVWDDIVYGNTPEEHTQNLRAALNRIRELLISSFFHFLLIYFNRFRLAESPCQE